MADIHGGMAGHHRPRVPQAAPATPRKRRRNPGIFAVNPDRDLRDLDPKTIKPFSHLERQTRRAHKQSLKARNFIAWRNGEPETKPTRKQWVTCVATTAIEIPKWAQKKAWKHLSQGEHYAWFLGRPRFPAKMLAFRDEQAGGKPEMTVVEYRRCKKCGRVLLSLEAEDRRRLDESCPEGRKKPCGMECGK
jgi:hypothetical protein